MRWLSPPSELAVEALAAELLLAGAPVRDVFISESSDDTDDEITIGERLHIDCDPRGAAFVVVESETMRAVCMTPHAGAVVTFVCCYLNIGERA